VVEIGTAKGGTLYAWCGIARLDALLVSIDLPDGPFGGGYSEEEAARFRAYAQPEQELHFLRRDSHDPETLVALQQILAGRRIDLLFIDGDHAYYGVRRDFEMYAPLVADDGLIVLHDVLPHPEVPEAKVDVLWREIKDAYEHLEFVDRDDDRGWGPWGGIGVLFNPPRKRRSRSATVPADVRDALMDEVARGRAESAASRATANASGAELERLRDELAQQRRAAAQRARELAELSKAVENERHEAHVRVAALEDQLGRDRRRRDAETRRARDELRRQQRAWAEQRAQWEEERATWETRLRRAEVLLDQERRLRMDERRQWTARLETLDDQIAVLADEVERGRGAQEFLDLVVHTRGWRILDGYRKIRTGLRRTGRRGSATREARWLPRANTPDWAKSAPPPPKPESIAFTRAGEVTVSIVVPVYENVEVTLRCLDAIARNTPHAMIDVVVVDDASSTATAEALGRVRGVRLVRNERNLGFLGSCNRGASEARGEFILFLNNDTRVTPGWLDGLLDAARSGRVGAVGSKLVYPDGSLQEAGGIIWSDASGWNFGRGDDPEAPEYNVRREVDYCSAASLLVRRDLFERVGGFDERFSPGYYEDTDLCFSLREQGFATLYEPTSVVVHYEGATHGTEAGGGVQGAHGKANQYRNRHVFRAKWAMELAGHWPPGTARGYRGGRIDHLPRVLVADSWVPAYDRDSGSLRMTWILRLLRSIGCGVTLLPLNRHRTEPYSSELQALGVEVLYGAQSIHELVQRRGDLYDLVVLSRPNVAGELLDPLRVTFPRAIMLYDTVDLHFLRDRRRAEVLGEDDTGALARARTVELNAVRRSDVTAAITDEEAALVRERVPGVRTVVLPNVHSVDPAPPRSFEERADLLFIGSFQHEPNVDAARYLVEAILPRVRDRLDARLVLLGSDPPREIRRLQSLRVVVPGYLPDVDDYFRNARVFVAPLRYGAGMKGKVGHALAFGLPVVTTAIGAEGMGLVDGEHAFIADDPDELADAVVRLYTDPALWARMADAGREVVWRRWSPASMRGRLEAVLNEVLPADRFPRRVTAA